MIRIIYCLLCKENIIFLRVCIHSCLYFHKENLEGYKKLIKVLNEQSRDRSGGVRCCPLYLLIIKNILDYVNVLSLQKIRGKRQHQNQSITCWIEWLVAKGIQKKQSSGGLLEPSRAPGRLELEGTLGAILFDFPLNAGMSRTTTKTWTFQCPSLNNS